MPVEPADTWVFGYGSLMWNPGFSFEEARPARLTGYHRAFCVYSIHYRGTTRRPGLVLGLDRGGVCDGIAFRIGSNARERTLTYLRRRELIYGVYREALVPLDIANLADDGEPGRTVWAVTYIAERAHPAYAGALPLARQARMIRGAAGRGGTNLDYALNTRRHLADFGIREPALDRLATVLGPIAGRCPNGAKSLARSWAWKPHSSPPMVRDNRFGYRAKLV